MGSQTQRGSKLDPLPVLENEKSYKQWKNAVSMWSLVTDVERDKQALVVALNLTGKAREAALEIDSTDLNKEDGVTTLLNRLDDRRLEIYRAFQKLDNLRKSPFQSMREYVTSFQMLCDQVRSLGIAIPVEVLALRLLNGSGMIQMIQEDILKSAEDISIAGIGRALLSGDPYKHGIFTKKNASSSSNGLIPKISGSTNFKGATKNVPATANEQSFKFNYVQPSAAVVDLAAKLPGTTKKSVPVSETKQAAVPMPKFEFNFTKPSAGAKLPGATAKTPVTSSVTLTMTDLEFKADNKPGMWKCANCIVKNEATDTKCSCCGRVKPNVHFTYKSEDASPITGQTKFGVKEQSSVLFECKKENVFDIVNPKSDPAGGFPAPKMESIASSSNFSFDGSPKGCQSASLPTTKPTFGMPEFKFKPIQPFDTADSEGVTIRQHAEPHDGKKDKKSSGQDDKTTGKQARPPPLEIHYPEHIKFPETENGCTTEWNFRFQAPEDVEKDNKKLQAEEEAEDAETSHNDDGPHFEPLVTLPEVEVRTGEEDEDAVFSKRAKLYRWHEGQWKERGVGLMKILKHKETGKYRLLMRRDQILKICCNHFIGESLDLQSMPKTEKAWMWHAMDFSEEGGKQEGLVIRFKTAEYADEFKEKFIEGQKSNAKISGGTPVRPATKPSSTLSSPTHAQSTSTTTPSVSVSQTTVPTSVVQSATSDPMMPKFKFALPKPSAAALDLEARIAGTPPKTPEQDSWKEHGDEPDGGEDDDVHNETGDGPHFEPIIKLPDKVETKTGEEDEEVLFCHGAKLYRFADKQWKERGVGDIKILHNKNSQKCRIVMRRDQDLKLCANHYITTDMSLSPITNSDRAWTWTAMDHSDPDSHPQQEFLAIRFKLIETAMEFAKFFNHAKDILDVKEVSDARESMKDTPCSVSTTPVLPTFTTSASAKPQTSSQSVQSQVVDSISKGMLVAKKEVGNWNCPRCYSPNLATDLECPCCYTPNPNASKTDDTAAKPNAPASKSRPTFAFGIPSGGSSTSSFSFGIKPAAAKTPSFGAPTNPLTSASPSSTDSIVSSTVPQKAGKWNCSDCYAENKPTDEACPCCGKANPNAPTTSKVETTGPKPGLFSFGLNPDPKSTFSFGINKPASDTSMAKQDYYEEDSDEYETTAGESSEEEEEYDAEREERYRSPLNRPQQEQKQDEDNDVICLGEVLPSEELQKKAESLMLPKHFYNFVKDGEDDTEDESESEGDQTAKQVIAKDKSLVTATVTVTTTSQTSTFGFGAAAVSTFADIVKSNAKGGFAFGGESVGWVGKPDQKALSQRDTSQDEEYYQNEEADVHFEPVVRLPEKVETVTGEEDDEVLYSQRCKLYRFNKPTYEWKERGLGAIKILKNLKTGRIRIVMRREQVLKVCANHYIRPGMSLDPNKTSDRAWTWTAMDFTEDEDPKLEVFTARFKTVEISKEFKDKFDICQAMLLDVDPMTPCKASSMRTHELSEKAEQIKNELRFFKDKFPEPPKVNLENTLTGESTLEQKPTPAVGSLTPLLAQHTASLRQSASENTTQTSIFQTPQKPKSVIPSDSQFSFQMTTHETEYKKVVTSKESREHTASVSSDDPQAEKDIHFEPIVQLPEKVDLITGEEDEQVIFGNRAKLYAFHKERKEWKERGLSDVKILQNFSTLKVRVVMRREQVFKVCLNHLIQQEYNLTFKEPTAGRTLLWTARDYSDAEKPDGEILQFALRFKTSEIANSFKDLWEAGADAAASKTLLDPDPSDINISKMAPGVTSPGPVIQSPQSPQSPVKRPTPSFSFANVPSPLDTKKVSSKGPVNVMGFVFGKPQESETLAPNNEGFKYDTSKMLFNSGGTSTPQGAFGGTPTTAYFTPPQTAPGTKTNASKSLFQNETDTTVDSNFFMSSSETFTQPDQTSSTTLFGDQSPAAQPKEEETKPPFPNGSVFGAVVKNYKPSHLAVASDATKSGSAFSHPSGRFQFKPVATEPSAQKIADNEALPNGLPDDDDIIFVSELEPTDEQRKRAEDLLLPSTFFLFENKLMASDIDEKTEDENEKKILKFIEERNSGKLDLKKKTETLSSGSGDTAGDGVPATPSDSSSNGSSWVFGGGTEAASTFASIDSGSFAALAGSVQNMGFKNDPSLRFQSQSGAESEEHPDPSSFKSDAQFKPVLKELPPLIEVKTGEEGEEVLFKERCKLYRYDKDRKEWKERGVGEIKILRNEEHKLHRVVMRRDQVYKVCTNHVIGENSNPELHLGSTKSCSYFVMDYSENQIPTPEKIAIRFRTDELCKAYMDKIAEIKRQQEC